MKGVGKDDTGGTGRRHAACSRWYLHSAHEVLDTFLVYHMY